jgi:hypothetical protein
MTIFLITVIIILIAVFRKQVKGSSGIKAPKRSANLATPSKSNNHINRSITTPSINKVKSKVYTSIPKPSDMSTELANKHFGWQWQEFLSTQPQKVSLTQNQIATIAGWAYQKLDEAELQDLLNSFVKVETNNGVTTRKPFVCTELHRAAYHLMIAGRFESVPFKLALKKIIAEYRLEVLTNVRVPAKIVVSPKLVESIIDVGPIDQKIIYSDNDLQSDDVPLTAYSEYNPDDYKLGKLYKETLKLSSQEAAWLNKFLFYGNTFNSTEGCKIALIRLYLQVIKRLVRRFANEPNTLSMHLENIKTAAYETSLKDRDIWYGYNHNQAKDAAEADLYYVVFKKCETALRLAWRAGRSSAPSFHSRSEKAVAIFNKNIEPVLDEVVSEQAALITPPDEDTIIALNVQSTTRWKVDFDAIVNKSNELSVVELKDKIYEIVRLNVANPAIENLFYDACKIFARIDKTEALRFYLYYIDADQRSARIDNKDFQKTTLKQLFADEAQEKEFRAIVAEMIGSKNLKAALDKVKEFYQPKRKRIMLDNAAIERAAVELNNTVTVLNQYLLEDEDVAVLTTPKVAEKTYAKVVQLNSVQQELLNMFDAVGLQLSITEVAEFAKTKGLFKNQLIDSINDSCYEIIDDVLIEEDDDQYIILPNYFKQIFD